MAKQATKQNRPKKNTAHKQMRRSIESIKSGMKPVRWTWIDRKSASTTQEWICEETHKAKTREKEKSKIKGNNAKRRKKSVVCILNKGIVGPVGYCVVTGVATQALLVDQIVHVKSFDTSNSWYQRFVVTIHTHTHRECGPVIYFTTRRRGKNWKGSEALWPILHLVVTIADQSHVNKQPKRRHWAKKGAIQNILFVGQKKRMKKTKQCHTLKSMQKLAKQF